MCWCFSQSVDFKEDFKRSALSNRVNFKVTKLVKMDFTESTMKLSTTPFSINDILTSNNQQSLSKKLKQFCRFRRSSLDCFIVSKDEQGSKVNENSDKNYVQLFNNNNPLDMRCRHSDINVSGN